jgi:hypothetical protein
MRLRAALQLFPNMMLIRISRKGIDNEQLSRVGILPFYVTIF